MGIQDNCGAMVALLCGRVGIRLSVDSQGACQRRRGLLLEERLGFFTEYEEVQ